ncbi:MAG: oxidoreductase C-terminal domain-containing protein [Solirubrobacteraceae bacterium]
MRGSLDDGVFSIFYVAGDAVVAAMTVGRPEDLEEARALMVSGALIDA